MMKGEASPWLGDLRARATARFESMAWPTTAEEEWRRTDLEPLGLSSFRARPEAESPIPSFTRRPASAGHARFVSGACVELSLDERWFSLGVRLLSLEDAGEGEAELLRKLLFEAYESAEDRVAVWHFAELRHGAFLYVPPGLEVDEPFSIQFEQSGRDSLEAPQLAVVLDQGARATLILGIGESGASRLLCNARSDLLLREASALKLFESQSLGIDSLHFGQVRARLGRGSSLERVEAQLGAGLARTRVDCSLEGRGAQASLNGLYYCGPGQHADVGTIQRHVAGGATSRAYYKGAASGGGRAVFQGLIEVGEGASGTDAYLSNRNLLLGDAARADSIPTLKIGNNDVRCSHGSTTGRLGEEELFYLRSRGFSESEARELLVLGFFEEVLAGASEAFRVDSLAAIRRRLPEAV
jgi:Fe-S cluster assembly protein SufD